MFPIKDHNPTGRIPYVTYTIMALNIAVFALMLPAYGNDQALFEVYYRWGMVPAWVTENTHLSTLFTSMFIHGGILHLAGNMLFLWIFGDNLEDELGHVGFIVFYLASGLGAAGLQILADPISQTPIIGASGAIAGVMGGYLLLFPKARVDVLIILIVVFRIFPVPAWIMLALWFAMQVFNGVAAASGEGGVAYWAHAGGFIVGFLWVLPLWLRHGGTRYWSQNHGKPPHPDATYRLGNSRVPRVKRR